MLPPRDTRPLLRQQRKLAPETAGKKWFDLPAPQMTDDMKRDLKLLQLRGTFDPKRFYKSSDHKKSLPKFFQVGTVVESAADFYSGLLTAHADFDLYVTGCNCKDVSVCYFVCSAPAHWSLHWQGICMCIATMYSIAVQLHADPACGMNGLPLLSSSVMHNEDACCRAPYQQ